MTTFEWAQNADEIEDARDSHEGAALMLERALHWAERANDASLKEYRDTLALIFVSKGYCGGAALNRAVEILIDAYLTEHKRRAA